MVRWSRVVAGLMVVVAVVLAGGLVYEHARGWWTPDTATVDVVGAGGGTLGTVHVRTAVTLEQRRRGLSGTKSLGPNEGMLFIHEIEGNYAYVMRDMAFPIDIVFVGGDRSITAIYHAQPEQPPYTRYTGRAKWVLEVPYDWTTAHGVVVGDRIRIDWPS